MRKTNNEIIVAFFNGELAGQSDDLRIEGRNLRGMNTIFAQRIGDGEGRNHFVINATRYNDDTTSIQNTVINEVQESKILRIVADVPIGVEWLI